MPHATPDIWSIEGRFEHLVFSPKGAIEGLLIVTDGVPTQFVTDPHDTALSDRLCQLAAGQVVVLEGSEEGPSSKREAPHSVYRLTRLASVNGQETEPPSDHADVRGKVVRFNYAKHGEPNGVVLDTGDFIHTKPPAMARMALKIGDEIHAEGPARPLVTGGGRVVEAHRVNGETIDSDH
jgi:hypothetical protein